MIEGCKHGPTFMIPQPCAECERERLEEAERLRPIMEKLAALKSDAAASDRAVKEPDHPLCKDDEHVFGPCKTCGMPYLASRLEPPTPADIAWAQSVVKAEASDRAVWGGKYAPSISAPVAEVSSPARPQLDLVERILDRLRMRTGQWRDTQHRDKTAAQDESKILLRHALEASSALHEGFANGLQCDVEDFEKWLAEGAVSAAPPALTE